MHTSLGTRVLTAVIALLWVALPAAALSPLLKELEDTYVQLGKQVLPAVVNIDVTSRLENGTAGLGGRTEEELFRFFGITPDQMPDNIPSQGSGFVYDSLGHVVTNSHVVSGAETIQVRLHDGREYEATVVGSDTATDIAVIKITLEEGETLTVATLGDSDALHVGQFAVAIGSPRGLEGSLSFGHISALGRDGLNLPGLDFQKMIQTDAAINLGNSGGPLCNIDGRVVGINTAIISGANAIGFAIPINMAKKVVPMLIEQGRVSRGFLGVMISDAATFAAVEALPFETGAYVENIEPDGPADRAGIKVYDVIRKVGETEIRDATHLRDTVADQAPDAEIVLEVWRGGASVTMTAKLGDRGVPGSEAPPEANLLGVEVQELNADIRGRLELPASVSGVVVSTIESDGPAHAAGVRAGTIILDVAKKPVPDVATFRVVAAEQVKPGRTLTLRALVQGAGGRVLIVTIPDAP